MNYLLVTLCQFLDLEEDSTDIIEPNTTQIKMLRRPATTIKLTPEDILEYDDSIAMKQQSSFSHVDQTQEQDKLHPIIFKEPLLTRNERIGIPEK